LRLRMFLGIALALLVGLAVRFVGTGGQDDSPANIKESYRLLSTICLVRPLCPVSSDALDQMKGAIAGDSGAEYLLGLTLLTGDGLPQDRRAGLEWVARAAEHGEPGAARDISDRLRNGAAIEVDESSIAAALQRRVDGGDKEAMRALGPMILRGRGAKQDGAAGLALLKRAASLGSTGAEADLAALYLNGAPGVAQDREESLKWFESSARHGDADAMTSLGYLVLNAPKSGARDVARSYCWLARAALLDRAEAQEKLSTIFATGEADQRGGAIAPDAVQADAWFRLAARSPYHDNSQIRAAIESDMTTDQLEAAKRFAAAWKPRGFDELKTLDIPLPPAARGGASPGKCPPIG